MDNNNFGKFIVELRKEKGLTQQQLAEKLYITDNAVSKWERGLSFPDITILKSLAEILEVDVSELLNCKKGNKENVDIQKSIDDALENNSNWNPQNYYRYSQGNITIKKAIETGSNLVKIRALQDIGIENSYEFVKSIGITGLREEYDKNLPALALGGTTQGVKPIEISSAYRTVLTDGIYRAPIFYSKVIDSNGEVYLKNEQDENYVVKEEVCEKLKSCFSTIVNEKEVYIKETKHQQNWEHWCNITTDKYTYTTICYHSEGGFKEINSKENTAKELLAKIID